jgi:hypothetical protein
VAAIRRMAADVSPYGWISALTGANGTRGATHDEGRVGRLRQSAGHERWQSDGGDLTVVVDVADTGFLPAAGARLRRLAVRLTLAAGLAGIALVLGAVLASTASADELPATASDSGSTGNGLLGTLVGSVTNTVTGTVQSTLSTTLDIVDNTVDTTVDTVGTVVDSAVGSVVGTAPGIAPEPATPVTATPVTTHTSAPVAHTTAHPRQAVSTRPVRHHPVVTPRHAATVAPAQSVHVAHPVTPTAHTAGLLTHRPARLPSPATPQCPNPAVPASSSSAGHGPTGSARSALAVVPCHADLTATAGSDGWSADPATLAARSQGLPATAPD